MASQNIDLKLEARNKLMKAIKAQDLVSINAILDEARDTDVGSPWQIMNYLTKEEKDFLKMDVNFDSIKSPLIESVRIGNPEIVEGLLARGANPNLYPDSAALFYSLFPKNPNSTTYNIPVDPTDKQKDILGKLIRYGFNTEQRRNIASFLYLVQSLCSNRPKKPEATRLKWGEILTIIHNTPTPEQIDREGSKILSQQLSMGSSIRLGSDIASKELTRPKGDSFTPLASTPNSVTSSPSSSSPSTLSSLAVSPNASSPNASSPNSTKLSPNSKKRKRPPNK